MTIGPKALAPMRAQVNLAQSQDRLSGSLKELALHERLNYGPASKLQQIEALLINMFFFYKVET